MKVQFHKNVTYRSRIGVPVIMSLCGRYGEQAVVEVEICNQNSYPSIEFEIIRSTEDGREFLDLNIDGNLCRVWATDAER